MDAKSRFKQLSQALISSARSDEFLALYWSGESTDFCRLNHNKIRQAGKVDQQHIELTLFTQQRTAAAELSLCGQFDPDVALLKNELEKLRVQIKSMPVDPHQLIPTSVESSERLESSRLPPGPQMIAELMHAAKGTDLVGILASGGIFRGFASTAGQFNWYETWSFNLDWSQHVDGDKAVKSGYAGFTWDSDLLRAKLERCREHLEVLKQPAASIKPGRYRVYLAPQALSEILGLLSWGSFGVKAQRTKSSPLQKMIDDNQVLHPSVTLAENTAGGIAPSFDSLGFKKPGVVTLIEEGRIKNPLVSARSAREFSMPPTGSSVQESPLSIDMRPGQLEEKDILQNLGTGVFINNLWYLNYSDRVSCRMTGMTRFATFWVENGKIVKPLGVMRFDDTIYNMLGKNLIGLTRDRTFAIESGSYSQRAVTSHHLPGALVDQFAFTL
jgi:predicted Zn-dependent protease